MSVSPRYERWGLYHAVRVAELRAALKLLEPTDILWPNEVRNLSVFRGENAEDFIGFVDLGDLAGLTLFADDEAAS